MRNHIISALQLGSAPEGTAVTVEHILAYEKEIIETQSRLLVLPEAVLGGYPKGSDFGTRVGYRTDEGRQEFLHYWQQTIDLDGPEIQAVTQLAKRCDTTIVIGVIERGGSTLYCTALFISNEGHLVAKHRKLIPTASERLIWGRGDGSTIPVLQTATGKIGAAICWENYMPLLRTTMYAKGIEIWCAPTVDDRDIWQASMRHIAYEGRCFLISACQYIQAPAKIKDKSWPPNKPLIRGGSVIVSPMGEILAGPLYEAEGLVSAEINLDELVKARYDLDPVGHYARPDIFKLTVNEQACPPFVSIDQPSAKS